MTTITPQDIVHSINEYIVRNSGFEERRNYLSLSHLAECPRRIAREYRDGYEVQPHTHHMAYAGYEQERNVRELLLAIGVLETAVQPEVISPLDSRIRGHLDGICDGNVIELKSINNRKWEKVVQKKDRVIWHHYVQVQMYMRYSGMKRALVIYRNRETYEHMVVAVPYSEGQADKFERKALDILRAIDEGRLPECECGKCGE